MNFANFFNTVQSVFNSVTSFSFEGLIELIKSIFVNVGSTVFNVIVFLANKFIGIFLNIIDFFVGLTPRVDVTSVVDIFNYVKMPFSLFADLFPLLSQSLVDIIQLWISLLAISLPIVLLRRYFLNRFIK